MEFTPKKSVAFAWFLSATLKQYAITTSVKIALITGFTETIIALYAEKPFINHLQ